MDVCKCIGPLRHGDTLNSHRAASLLVKLVEGEESWEAFAPREFSFKIAVEPTKIVLPPVLHAWIHIHPTCDLGVQTSEPAFISPEHESTVKISQPEPVSTKDAESLETTISEDSAFDELVSTVSGTGELLESLFDLPSEYWVSEEVIPTTLVDTKEQFCQFLGVNKDLISVLDEYESGLAVVGQE
ncbi:hypothetical protein TNCV_1983591 [Trichonephila clavipes]|nr:hypothetical protein TNCV_1983591 [Trichonephila clavipes]